MGVTAMEWSRNPVEFEMLEPRLLFDGGSFLALDYYPTDQDLVWKENVEIVDNLTRQLMGTTGEETFNGFGVFGGTVVPRRVITTTAAPGEMNYEYVLSGASGIQLFGSSFTDGTNVTLESFTPAQQIAPATVNIGQTVTSTVALSGSGSEGGVAFTESGTDVLTFSAVGWETLTLPAGTFQTVKTISTQTKSFTRTFTGGSVQSITDTAATTTWLVFGVGPVKVQERQTEVVDGVTTTDQTVRKHLTAFSNAEPSIPSMAGDFTGTGRDSVIFRTTGGDWFVVAVKGSPTFWGHWDPTVDWVDIRVADLNNDGADDIIGRANNTGQWWAGISNGSSFINRFMGAWSTSVIWLDVQAADLNGDGAVDVFGRTHTGHWWAGISTGTSLINIPLGVWATTVTWSDVRATDLNNDGRADVIGRVAETGQWWAGIANFSGTLLVNHAMGAWSPALNWMDVQVADINADGRVDVIGRAAETGQWWAGLNNVTGTAFANLFLTAWSNSVAWVDVRVGDYNHDNRDDVVGRTDQGEWWAGLSTGGAFSNQKMGQWSTAVRWTRLRAGDLTADGFTDVFGSIAGTDVFWAGVVVGAPTVQFQNQLYTGTP